LRSINQYSLKMSNHTFAQCLQSYSSRLPQIEQLLQNDEMMAVLGNVVDECTEQVINQNSFVLRGVVGVRSEDLCTAIRGLVQHLVDDVAAQSISEVREFALHRVQVKCNSSHQCKRIMQRRLAFSSTNHPRHQSAAVQQLLSINLYVDNYCTKEQLRLRSNQWQLFRELKSKDMHPHFKGAQLYYRPEGADCHIPYTTIPSTEQHAAVAQEQLHAAQHVLQEAQQQEAQPMAEQVAAQPAMVQAVHHAQAAAEPPNERQATTSAAPAMGSSAGSAAGQEAPAAPASKAPATSASPVTAVKAALAPRKEAHNQRQPLQKKSKNAHTTVNPAAQRITRPPLHTLRVTISNTPARLPSSGTKANSHSGRPVWGAHSGPYWPSRVGRISDMLPNGTHFYR
jgi:hypothetical protein